MSMKTVKWRFVVSICLVFLMPLSIRAQSDAEKYKIKSVHFEGNRAFSDKRLHNVMISRPSSLFNTVRFYRPVLQKDLENLERFYNQHGYLQASVQDHSVALDSSRRTASIRISIAEGPLTRVEGVSIFGNEYFSEEQLLENISIQSGDPLLRKAIEKANTAILSRYADHGFLDAEVKPDVKVDNQNHRALIDFIIEERTRYRVGVIHIQGLEKTRPHVVRRELKFAEGEIINYSKLLESQRALYLTGLFRSVFIRPQSGQKSDSSYRDVIIEIKENMSVEFNVSVGYGTIEKLRTRIETYNNNLDGTARKVGIAARLSFVQRGLEASFTEPWTFGTRWRTDINAVAENLEEPGYHLDRIGGRITIGRSFLKRSNSTLTYRQENVRLSDVRTVKIPDQLRNDVRSLKLSLIYDTRDNLFNTKKGLYFEWSNESAGAFLQGDINFLRSTFLFKYFKNLTAEAVLATAMDLGFIKPDNGLATIPLNERFYAGGPNTIRSFDYQKAGPLDENRIPTGGTFKVVWNALELRRTLYKMIGGAVFVDLGNVWRDVSDVQLLDLRSAIGAGLRINTPIGLGRLDGGWNPDPQNGEPVWKIYLSMGQAF